MLPIAQIWDAQKQELAGRVGATSPRIVYRVAEVLHDGKTAKIVPKADATPLDDVRFGSKSRHVQYKTSRPLWAKGGHRSHRLRWRLQTEHADSAAGRQKCKRGRNIRRQFSPLPILCAVPYFRSALAFFVTGLVVLKRLLNRGTRHVPVGAEYATVACLRLEPHAATGAVVEELTRVSRHRFVFDATAVRASNSGLQTDIWHQLFGCT